MHERHRRLRPRTNDAPGSAQGTAATGTLGVTLAMVLCACHGGDPNRGGECAGGIVPGDLVITEIFANPAGTDKGQEWFEIYNAREVAVDVSGLVLRSAKDDGGSPKEHVVTALTIEGKSWAVVGGVIEDPAIRPDHVDYGYGDDLGDLRNTAGSLAVLCGGNPIDEVLYDGASDATSRGFDGGRSPDASGNDDLTLWCDATTMFSADIVGTPGARNDVCVGSGVPTTCVQDGSERDVVAPGLGDLVLSEFHADPSAVGDDDGEWFEIYVGKTVDLNGVSFGKVAGEPLGTINGSECISITAGSYVVLARGDDPATNGGLESPLGLFDFSLGTSTGSLFLGYGDDVLDEIAWTGSDPGAASSLDPDFVTAAGNDDPTHFCAAITPYGAGDLGTPGAANDAQCEIAPPEGQCWDGTAFVDVIAPGVGDLVITEFSANPSAVDDTAGEWIEITATAPVHLNGLELGRDGAVATTIDTADCILAGVGDALVIAREIDPLVNGGLSTAVASFDFSLVNSDGNLFIGYAGAVLDEITWPSSTAGAATALDPSFLDPADNDDPANWCTASTPYGDGDLGSPGETNPACGTVNPGTCNDGGTDRTAVPPTAGQLVITEFMPDPSAVSDANGEWFEVLVLADVDLNGVELGTEVGNPDTTLPVGGDCIAVTAGTRVVFARSDDMATNGGLPAVAGTFGFGLANGGGALVVGYGGEALDVVTWSGSTPGAASSLDPDLENPTDNDDQGSFCAATAVYGDGDRGTPGAIGDDCGGGGSGMCNDGGNMRAIVMAGPGDLVISEVMANPAAVADANGEYFELAVLANIDLNGLELSTTDDGVATTLQQTLASPNCLSVAAGSRALFVRDATMATNGGLPDGGLVFGFGLVNSNDGLAVGVAGTIIDAVTWATVPSGASRNLDEGALDAAANDLDANWCAASSSYGAGDHGTPMATNDACG
ncbi:MAG: hypothetical protein IPK74_17335 [Deltaproteobacteria bacterium]|nr:hypothetical protein [Deltaproteobacteria bacterium]